MSEAGPSRTVLVVDDDPATVNLLARSFRLEGYQVFTATDGERGLREVSRSRPDIVIADLRMPVLDGLAFLRQLRSRERRPIPVTILTGDRLLDDLLVAELQALGAALRFKPFWLKDMVELAESMLSAAGPGGEGPIATC